MEPVKIEIKKEDHAKDLPLPKRMSPGAAGLDLFAAINEDIVLEPGKHSLVPTGIAINMPINYEGQVRPRSGLALKHGITLLNSPGTIDSDYRGEIKAILINLGEKPFIIRRGDRIAQLVIANVPRIEIFEEDKLPTSMRGEKGFGHTGINE